MSNGVVSRRFSRRRFLKVGSAAAVVAVVAGVGGYSAVQQPVTPAPTPTLTPTTPIVTPSGVIINGVKKIRNLDYAGTNNIRQKLDLYMPVDYAGRSPVIVWAHGGAWRYGSKESPLTPQLVSTMTSEKGYAIASINYRLTPEAVFPAQIHDVKAAIRWLRAHADEFNLDPENIGAIGSSGGGTLVSLLGTADDIPQLEGDVGGNLNYSSEVKAVVDIFGPTNLKVFLVQECLPPKPETAGLCLLLTSALGCTVGCSQEEKEIRATRASPINYVTKDHPPFLILHGDQDDLVPIQVSQEFHKALQKSGVESTLIIAEGVGHERNVLLSQYAVEVVQFFDKHLRGTPTPTPGQILRVPEDYPTINEAIAAASPGA